MASRAMISPLRLAAKKSIAITIPAVRPITSRLFTTATTPLQAITPADPGAPVNPAAPLAPNTSALQQNLSIADKIALRFKDYIPNTTETYVAFDVTKELYTECALQAAYADGVDFSPSAKFWYETCNRPPTFQSWSQVTVLHMWMLAARMRALEKGRVKVWQQHFIDHFFYDSEDKMIKRYGIKRASERTGYMKDLYHQYRGMTAAYDEGLVKGDAVMATAIWRNVFSAQEDVDLEVLATITAYVRRAVSKLSLVDDDVVLTGRVKFGMPTDELPLARQKSSFLEGQ